MRGARGAPLFFSDELHIVWTFGGYMQVYTHKASLHGNCGPSQFSPAAL